jgi:hypothetical protein
MRLSLCLVLVVGVFIGACGSPTEPSRDMITVVVPASDPSVPTPTALPSAPSAWPTLHPDGRFGHEDPAYPPAPCQCAIGTPSYNGWNWVCRAGYLVEMPRRECVRS